MLGNGQESRRPLPVEILEQLVDMEDESVFLWHRGLIAVQAVNDDRLCPDPAHTLSNTVGKFSWRQLGCIDLFDVKRSCSAHAFEVETHGFRPVEQESQLFVEDEIRRLFAALNRSSQKLKDECAFSGPRGSENQGT